MIKLTEKSAAEIKKVLSEQDMNADEYCIKVGVKGGGCSGFQYSLGFEKMEDVDSQDCVISQQFDINVAVDRNSALYIDGTELDYYSGLEKRGFVFENPNATKSCGCGESFQV